MEVNIIMQVKALRAEAYKMAIKRNKKPSEYDRLEKIHDQIAKLENTEEYQRYIDQRIENGEI